MPVSGFGYRGSHYIRLDSRPFGSDDFHPIPAKDFFRLPTVESLGCRVPCGQLILSISCNDSVTHTLYQISLVAQFIFPLLVLGDIPVIDDD